MSGPPKDGIIKRLDKNGYEYWKCYYDDDVLSVVDYIKSTGVKMKQNGNGNWYCDNNRWWKAKSDICRQYKISIMFDDHLEYKETMDENTLFVHVK